MKIETTYLQEDNDGKRYLIHEEVADLADTYMDEDATVGDIYRASAKEYGRCTSKVYIDTKSRGVIAVGWVFVKRTKYDDSNETYLAETWVTLLDKDETQHIREYHEIGR